MRSAPDRETIENLVLENRLLRKQLDLLQQHTRTIAALKTAVQGAHPGDVLQCADGSYSAIVAAYAEPVGTAAELYTTGRPLPWPVCTSRILVQPDRPQATLLGHENPHALVINASAGIFLARQTDGSIDSVIFRSAAFAEDLEFDLFFSWVSEARRIARRQVIVSFESGSPLSSKWPPAEFSEAVVIARWDGDSHSSAAFTAFFKGDPRGAEIRVVILSEWDPRFHFRRSDIVVCDIELERQLDLRDRLRTAAFVMVPLRLLRSSLSLPLPMLRGSVLNFVLLENYVGCVDTVVPIGADATFVSADLKARRSAVHK